MRYAGLIPVGSGAATPVGTPALQRESQERWERIDRLTAELNGSIGEPEVVDSELDGPVDR